MLQISLEQFLKIFLRSLEIFRDLLRLVESLGGIERFSEVFRGFQRSAIFRVAILWACRAQTPESRKETQKKNKN